MKIVQSKTPVEITDAIIKTLLIAGDINPKDIQLNPELKYALADIGVSIASTVEIINKLAVAPNGETVKYVEKNGRKFGVIEGGSI